MGDDKAVEKPENKRTLDRFSLSIPATIEVVFEGLNGDEAEVMNLETRDVCAGGAFFNTDRPLPEGTQVKIEMKLSLDRLKELAGRQALISVTGKVIRTEEGGMAVRFEPDYTLKGGG